MTFNAGSSLRVTDPAQARVLSEPQSLRFLAPFVRRECSSSRATQELEVSLHRKIHWVKRLQVLGLIKASSVTGRTRSYRAVADAFFVPFSATNAETGEQLLERWNRPWHDIFVADFLRELANVTPDFGVRLQRNGEDLHVALALSEERDFNFFDSHTPNVLDGWVTNLYLDPQDAKAMQLEVLGVYLEYSERRRAQRYMTRVSFAPMQGGTDAPFSDRDATQAPGSEGLTA